MSETGMHDIRLNDIKPEEFGEEFEELLERQRWKERTMNMLLDLIVEGTRSAVILGERGKGKSQLIGTLAYQLYSAGWTVIIFDPKGTFQYSSVLNIADPEIATLVRRDWGEPYVDLHPWNAEFYMPYFSWDYEKASAAKHIVPAPVTMNMIAADPSVWNLLKGNRISLSEARNLREAYLRTGMLTSSPDAMIYYLKDEDKLSPGVAEILTSGLIHTKSPLEPEELLSKGNRVIILTSPLTVDQAVIAFWYGAILQSLFRKLKMWSSGTLNLAIFIDETLVLSHGTKQTTSSWWFTRKVNEFLSQGRQLGAYGTARTRVFLSSQQATAVDPDILELTGLAFISPGILQQDAALRYLRRHFNANIRKADARIANDPGRFYIYTNNKKIALVDFPISPIFIPKEYDSSETSKAEKQNRFIRNNFEFTFLDHLFYASYYKIRDILGPVESKTLVQKAANKGMTVANMLRVEYFNKIFYVLLFHALKLYELKYGELKPGDQISYKMVQELLIEDFLGLKKKYEYTLEEKLLYSYIHTLFCPAKFIQVRPSLEALGFKLLPEDEVRKRAIEVTEDVVNYVLPVVREKITRKMVNKLLTAKGKSERYAVIRVEYVKDVEEIAAKISAGEDVEVPNVIYPSERVDLDDEETIEKLREIARMEEEGREMSDEPEEAST